MNGADPGEAPFAWKNLGRLSRSGACKPVLNLSGDAVRRFFGDVLVSLMVLPGGVAYRFRTPSRPSPVVGIPFPVVPLLEPTVEIGLDLCGVPSGVLLGVLDMLSTRALLDPDLGVIFVFMNAFTGVSIPSLGAPAPKPFGSGYALVRVMGEEIEHEDPTSFGVT